MTRTQLLATAAVFVVAGAALAGQATAQTTTPAPAPTTEADQSGVLVFTPDFFAANRPNTAQDMVNRIPGFSINDGAQTRGFEGAVGNVLINGNRPASKNDTGSNVLSRTPASQVERSWLRAWRPPSRPVWKNSASDSTRRSRPRSQPQRLRRRRSGQ